MLFWQALSGRLLGIRTAEAGEYMHAKSVPGKASGYAVWRQLHVGWVLGVCVVVLVPEIQSLSSSLPHVRE